MSHSSSLPTLLAIGSGVLAVVLGTAIGWNEALRALVLAPVLPARVLLGSLAFVLGLLLVVGAADRLGRSARPPELIRAVRLVFLAVGAFAAAAGWFVASPVPIVAGLVIGGIDVLETSLLLLVTSARGGDAPGS
jgi:vacuolar-type H+-ATPase subunit I/STV1